MRRTSEPDPALVERIRSLLGVAGSSPGEGHADAATGVPARLRTGRGSTHAGWVPGPPADPGGSGEGSPDRGGPGTAEAARPKPRVVTVPAFLSGARLAVSRRALFAMCAFVLAAAGVFALRANAAARQGEPVTVGADRSGLLSRTVPAGFTALSGTPTGVGTTPASPSDQAASAGGGGPPPVLVHVVGQVASPGVVTLGAGSRVADALAKAGGTLPSADLARLNLARVVVDGEQVQVPAPGEALPPTGAGASAAATGTAGSLVNLNTADVAALDTLPGVGPVLAQRILQWRQDHGRFRSVEELDEVSGVGEKLFAQLKPRVTV